MTDPQTPHMDIDEQDAGKGAVEGDRPEDRPQQGNPHGQALDQDGLPKPLAYVVPRKDVEATPALASELKQVARTRLADYKRPRWVEFVEALPTTATGKVQRFKLRERASQHESSDDQTRRRA